MTSDNSVHNVAINNNVRKVAILPFKAATELIGLSVSDMFVTEMMRAGRYALVERSQMTQVLKEAELALTGLTAAGAIEVGKMLGADGVIVGTVDQQARLVVHEIGLALRKLWSTTE